MFNDLNPLLHSQLRLAIMSLLMAVEEAEFVWIKEKTGASAGNLSVQLNKLSDANYLEIEKKFKGNYPQTLCRKTDVGVEAFEKYVLDLQEYLKFTQPTGS